MSDIQLIVKAIKETLNPEKIILFGSYSRGEQTKDSDIDLAVIKKDKPELGEVANVYTKLRHLGYEWEVSPDIHLFAKKDFEERLKNNSFFISEVAKGKVIYAN